MSRERRTAGRAVFLATVMLCSVIAGGVGFAGGADASQSSSAAVDLTAAGDVAAQVDVSASSLSGSGTADDPYVINNSSQLQAMEDNLDAHYRLGSDIDASNTSTWNGGNGFDPVGNDTDRFIGSLDGNGHTITGLTIDRPNEEHVGLFGGVGEYSAGSGTSATIVNVSLTNVSVVGDRLVGGVAGQSEGTDDRLNPTEIRNVTVSGNVTGQNNLIGLLVGKSSGEISDVTVSGKVKGDFRIGGLVGFNTGDITNVATSATVTTVAGTEQNGGDMGGVVGLNQDGRVINATASGDVISDSNDVGGIAGRNVEQYSDAAVVRNTTASGEVEGLNGVGGLVGTNGGTVARSTATGNITSVTLSSEATNDEFGGLVGGNGGSIMNSTASGDVNSMSVGEDNTDEDTGGLVGLNTGSIANTKASGTVNGEKNVGGLVGRNGNGDTIRDSFAVGLVVGDENKGGVVGNNLGTVEDAYWDTKTANRSDSNASRLLTAQMQGDAARTNMPGLDFDTVWQTQPSDYPALRSMDQLNAVNDTFTTAENTTRTVSAPGVLENDSDPNGDPLTAAVVSGPANGTLIFNADGSFEYTPDPGFFGTDSFTYNASDGTSADTATVIINVSESDEKDSQRVDVSPNDLTGNGTEGDPYVITNASELQAMEDDLSANYTLENDIDASNTSTWNGGKGFDPVGGVDDKTNTPGSSFSGTFDGNEYTITGLTIARQSEDYVGLFGNTSDSTIKAVTLTSVSVTGNENVGGLVGDHNGGTIQNVSIGGTVTGKGAGVGGNPGDVGGLAGITTRSTVSNVSASVTVTGFKRVGGVVGVTGDDVEVRDVSATGDIKGEKYDGVFPEHIGGLIGLNRGSIRTASASGKVNGSDRVGGLAGWNDGNGKIRNVSASGSVEGFLQTGGLVGLNSGTIEKASASGDVLATSSGGGLVGINSGNITNAWASGAVTIEEDGQNLNTDFAGGLVAENDGTIEDTFAVGKVSSQEPPSNVSVGGLLAQNYITTYPPKGTVRDSYWDRETTNRSTSAENATALNTSQMTGEAARSNMSGLTYGEVWTIRTNDYPVLIDDPKGPTASDDTYSTPEDTTLTVSASAGVLDNDSDPDNDTLTAAVATRPTNGSLTLYANGSFIYQPDADFAGTDSFTYNVSDGTITDTATVTITVTQVNDPPTAVDDSYTTPENSTLSVSASGVLANDSDPENDVLNATPVSDPTNGSLTLNASGSFEYTPDQGFFGTDSFTYNATDGELNSTATVTITITERNDPPTAVEDSYTTSENTALNVSAPGILDNDSDPNGDTLNATPVSDPRNGSLTLNADGSFEYTPDTDFTGTDSFTYSATDGELTDTATVTINVTAKDDTAPVLSDAEAVARDDRRSVVRDDDVVEVSVNVTDPGGSVITSVTADASRFGAGTVSLSETTVEGVYRGSFTVNASKPQAKDGSELLKITATDGAENSDSTTTGFALTLDTQPPVARATANQTKIDPGDTIRFNASSSTDNTRLNEHRWDIIDSNDDFERRGFFGLTKSVTYRFASAGTYTVDLNVSDTAGNTNTTSITVDVGETNQAPTAADDTYTTPENTTLDPASDVLENDFDPNGDVLSATLVTGPTNGTLSLAANGNFSYTPNANFTGTDSFTYNATDREFNSTATVTITVTAVNDAPIARNNNYTVNESTDRDLSTLDVSAPGVLGNDSDPDGDSLSTSVVSGPTNGTLSLATNGSLSYTPYQGFTGTDSFTYEASDGGLTDTATVTITVTETNQAPIARNDSYIASENRTLTVSAPGVLDDDSDPDGDSLTADIVSSPDNGTLTLAANGSLSYTPAPGFNGSDSFTYEASDGSRTDTGTVIITVESAGSPDGTAPTLTNPALTDVTDSDGVVTGGDRIEASVAVTDTGGSGLADVLLNASGFGASNVPLTDGDDGIYNGTFTVDAVRAGPDGTVTPRFGAVDTAGNRNRTVGPSLTLDTTAPGVSIDANNTTVGVGETVEFVANADDATSSVVSYTWQLGDGTTASGPTVNHSYASTGTYAVEVTVTDDAGNTNTTTAAITVSPEDQAAPPADPVIRAPEDGIYAPTRSSTPQISYNATGVIDSGDVGIVVRNATAGNGTVVASEAPGSAEGTEEVLVPAGSLSGDVTLNVTLVNTTEDRVYASDLVNLTAVTAPAILTPADDAYDPTAETTIGTFHNADGVIAPGDVGVRLRNVTGTNDTVVANNASTSLPVVGTVNTTIPTGAIDGNVTLRAELYNTSNGTTEAAGLVNLTAPTDGDDGTDEGFAEPAPVVLVPSDGTYDPTEEFTASIGYNATGFVAPDDVEIRFRNATAGNGTVVATATPGSPSGNAGVTIPAGTFVGDVTINVTLANGTTDAVYASELVNLTAETPDDDGDSAPPAPAIFAPANATYDPDARLNFTTFHNATGVIAPSDVGVRLRNVTGTNDTVVARNTSLLVDGEADLRVEAGALDGNVTVRTELYNTSSPGATAAETITNLTVDSADAPPTAVPSVVASNVSHAGGTQPDLSNVSLHAEFSGGLLQVQLRNESYVGLNNGGEPGGNYELEGVGVDDSTRIRVNVTVANFTPRVLIGSARDVNWSRTRTADGDWTLSITGSPVEVHSYFGNNNNPPDEWTGSLTATQSQNQTITYAVDGLSTVSPTYRERLNGSVFLTDAQRFGAPTYNASATPDRVELEVAAPHYETDGKTVNEGLFEAYIPPSLLDEWGVSASDLVGKFDGTRKSTTVSTTPDGGARVSFDVTYSEETAVVTYNGSDSTAPTVLAPGDSGYVPSERTNLSLDYNATGVIAPSDVEIVVRNATAGNGTIVGNATPGSVNGTTRIAIPAGTLSGDVTLNVTLVNATDRIVYASDPVTLTAETVDDGGGQEGGGEGGIALPPSPGVTLTTSDLAAETLSSLDVTFNVSGESVDASDVELWLYNASDGRELVGKTTQVGTKSGLSAVTVPADELGGGAFTAEIQVVANSTGSPLVLANSSSIVFAYEGVSTSVGAQTVTDAEGEGIEVTYDLGNIAPENATIRLAETTIGSGLGTRSVPVSDSSGTATVEVNASELNRNATFQAYILDENRGRPVQSSISHGAVGFDGSPTPSITDASVSYANGSDVSGVEVNASFDFQHKAVDWYLHPDGQPDTREIGTAAGIDSDTRLRVNVTVENFDPLFAVGTANATDWETTQIDGNTTRITFALTPAEADWDERITNPDPREWPLVNGSATVSYDAIVDITTFSLEGQQTGRERLRGGLIASDAQAFAPPQYTLPSNGDPGALEIAVASPHYEPDGRTVSTGFYRAIIPDAIIADWGVSPSQLTATYQGKRAPLTVRQLPSGGVRVFTPIGYSSGTVSVTGNTSAPQVTTFEAMNPTGRDVNLTIEVDRELDEIAVNLSGPESAVLTEADFEETQHSDGSYTYNASYAAGTDGTYEAALETAVDTSGTGITATVEDSVSVEGSTANFTASIAGTNEPVVAGETLEITATIENVGNESGTQQVSLNAGGQERDTESVQLDPGTNTTVTLSWTTAESEDGTYQATVATEHDTASTAVQVREPAFVDITIDSTNAPVVVGEHLTVTATIENTGDVSGTQTIRLSVNGTERNSTTRTLGPAESQEVQLTWNTTGVDAERYTVEVASSDDIATGTVSVQAAAANISVDSSSLSTDTTTAGGTVTVTATVNNTGAVAGTETIALSAGDTQLAMQEVTIDAGNTTEITFAEYGASLDPGTYEVRVGNRSAGTLTIEESSSGTGAPGFGVGTAVGALVLVALWARRRR
ncbi:Ig-like domain-containing protein [Halobellus clavatus]|uniref:Surface glycoprotein n=1 Tax=Halobellus clavatus TaxID=660517 RepID=A0A1H3EDW4_9EURY|nr:Ig-like domain-containing protein [Halobellus clavatus]SDX76109.1 surface glycoprotein [Halobellus clavatus]